MALKVYVLEGTISAGASETELDTLNTPEGRKRDIQEIRVYTSQTSDVKVYLYKNVDRLCEVRAENINLYKLPYPITETIGPGDELRLTAANSGASDSDVIVEVIVDETVA